MKSIIEEFYDGKVNPGETSYYKSSEYDIAVKNLYIIEKKLIERFDKLAKAIYDEYQDAQMDVRYIFAKRKFSYGFKLGMLLAIDVLTNFDDLTDRE